MVHAGFQQVQVILGVLVHIQGHFALFRQGNLGSGVSAQEAAHDQSKIPAQDSLPLLLQSLGHLLALKELGQHFLKLCLGHRLFSLGKLREIGMGSFRSQGFQSGSQGIPGEGLLRPEEAVDIHKQEALVLVKLGLYHRRIGGVPGERQALGGHGLPGIVLPAHQGQTGDVQGNLGGSAPLCHLLLGVYHTVQNKGGLIIYRRLRFLGAGAASRQNQGQQHNQSEK